MIHKPIDKIEKADIDALIENVVLEGRTLEYKEVLPGNSDDNKREFLADVSSFANASGGDLLYGIEPQRDGNNKPTGAPDAAVGLADVNVDDVKLRLDNIIRDGIDPRVPAVRIEPIAGFPKGPVLLLRIPKSWSSPHVVKFKNWSRFFTRNNAGKYQMDVTEIRSTFALSEALPERIRRFRDDRLAKVVADETPVRLADGPKLVLHIVPLCAFSVDYQLEMNAFKRMQGQLMPIYGGGSTRYNFDGRLTYSNGRRDDSIGYCQTFRNGIIESVNADLLESRAKGSIPSLSFEEEIIRATEAYLKAMVELGIPEPALIMLTLIGVKGREMATSPRMTKWDRTPIDRDLLLIPEVMVEQYGCDSSRLLRPIFDAVWNASGWEESPNYDEDGNWKPR